MADDPSIFLDKTPVSHSSLINTADGSSLHINHTGSVSTSNLSLPTTFHVPKLTINLISVGQLCDVGLQVIFFSSYCHVQDTQTGQVIGIGPKVGYMFELIHLHTPHASKTTSNPSISSGSIVASTSSSHSLTLWHSCPSF